MRLISAASARICGLAKPPNTARGAATAFGSKAKQLNILFLTNAHNGLSQRAKGVLEAQGHSVNVELALTQSQIKDVTADADPDVIICPFLTARVPEEIWRKGYPKPDVPVVIVHPGVQGDKGMSSIEWALKDGKPLGVTCLSAVEEMDAGPVWSTRIVPITRADPNTVRLIQLGTRFHGALPLPPLPSPLPFSSRMQHTYVLRLADHEVERL